MLLSILHSNISYLFSRCLVDGSGQNLFFGFNNFAGQHMPVGLYSTPSENVIKRAENRRVWPFEVRVTVRLDHEHE